MCMFCVLIVVRVHVLSSNSGSVHVFIGIVLSVHVLYCNGGTCTCFFNCNSGTCTSFFLY